MDDTADPPRASDVATMGSEADEASSASSDMRTVDEESSGPAATAGAVPPAALEDTTVADHSVECRDRAAARTAGSLGSCVAPVACPPMLPSLSAAAAAAAVTTPPAQQQQQQQQSLLTQPGCGCLALVANTTQTTTNKNEITVCITPTTGGQFEITADRNDTVENLKKSISKKLKVAKERICLLHRER